MVICMLNDSSEDRYSLKIEIRECTIKKKKKKKMLFDSHLNISRPLVIL